MRVLVLGATYGNPVIRYIATKKSLALLFYFK